MKRVGSKRVEVPPEKRRSSARSLATFRSTVWGYWKKSGRHNLPWRKTNDPYKILVSEIMLQQTQVDRVIPYYQDFLERFPTLQSLAEAKLADVLRVWSGLGYNRRAKLLRDCAKEIVEKHDGRVPKDAATLVSLPSIGPYSAGAIRAFAFNRPGIFIETNIRTAFFHHFPVFHMTHGRKRSGTVRDREIFEIARKAGKRQDPKKWHWALMDYGAYLKKSGVKLNQKSSHYTKQSKFEGSLRQARGEILRALAMSTSTEDSLFLTVELPRRRFGKALQHLNAEGLIEQKDGAWRLAMH